MKTFIVKNETKQPPKWHLIDAEGVPLGRLAVKAANIIRDFRLNEEAEAEALRLYPKAPTDPVRERLRCKNPRTVRKRLRDYFISSEHYRTRKAAEKAFRRSWRGAERKDAAGKCILIPEHYLDALAELKAERKRKGGLKSIVTAKRTQTAEKSPKPKL